MSNVRKKIGQLVLFSLIITALIFWLLPIGTIFGDVGEHTVTVTKTGLIGDDEATFTLNGVGHSTFSGSTTLGNGESYTFEYLHNGAYTLTETWPSANLNEYETNDYSSGHSFTISESQTKLTFTFNVVNSPVTPDPDPCEDEGTVTITKNIDVAQATDTVFTFDVDPSIDGQSSFQVTVPAGLLTADTEIDEVPFDDYAVTEDSLSGWTLDSSSNSTFTLNDDYETANPTFNNKVIITEPGTGTITITKNIDVAQAADTVFTFNVDPAIDSQSSFQVTVPAGLLTGSTEINDVPFDDYAVTEDSLSGWTLATSAAPFTLDEEYDTANPTFSNEYSSIGPLGGGLLYLSKRDSTNTTIPVAGAVYGVYLGGTLVERITTGPDGNTAVSLPFLDTTYTVREISAPGGYDLDPNSYSVIFTANQRTITLNVVDDPSGGGGTVTVAGLQAIQVLAFTGLDPIIPISGGSVIAGGLGLFIASFLRKIRRK